MGKVKKRHDSRGFFTAECCNKWHFKWQSSDEGELQLCPEILLPIFKKIPGKTHFTYKSQLTQSLKIQYAELFQVLEEEEESVTIACARHQLRRILTSYFLKDSNLNRYDANCYKLKIYVNMHSIAAEQICYH